MDNLTFCVFSPAALDTASVYSPISSSLIPLIVILYCLLLSSAVKTKRSPPFIISSFLLNLLKCQERLDSGIRNTDKRRNASKVTHHVTLMGVSDRISASKVASSPTIPMTSFRFLISAFSSFSLPQTVKFACQSK